MKPIYFSILILFSVTMCSSKPKEPVVLIQTTYGNIKVKLYNETPIHRDNFLKLAKEGFYKNLIFHRIIDGFMIQGGDPKTRNMAEKDTIAEDKTMGSTIPSEIKFPAYFHKKGALAAARWGNEENPEKASDPSQFYIVTGVVRSDNKLDEIEKQRFERLKQKIYSDLQSRNMDSIKSMYKEGRKEAIAELRAKLLEQANKEAESRRPEITYTEEQREFYKVRGGTPHLDNEYTVFGEVIEGMDVVDKIQKVRTNEKDKPFQNIFMNVIVLEE